MVYGTKRFYCNVTLKKMFGKILEYSLLYFIVNSVVANSDESLQTTNEHQSLDNDYNEGFPQTNSNNEDSIESNSGETSDVSETGQQNLIPKVQPGIELTPEDIEKFKLWIDGIVPYYIDVVSFSDKVVRDMIHSFLNKVSLITTLKFVELPSPPSDAETRWVFFINRRGLLGCADHSTKNFTNKGVQKVVLGYDCMVTNGEIAEAVMSIAGIPAQHNAPNRDKYITVHTENIMPEKTYLFEKIKDSDWLFDNLDYDFNSITHYDFLRYSVNGHSTIVPKEQSNLFNPSTDLSQIDILKIKKLYYFISKKRKLQGSHCKKLFKPGRKFWKHKTKTEVIELGINTNGYINLQNTNKLKGSENFDENESNITKTNEDGTDSEESTQKNEGSQDNASLTKDSEENQQNVGTNGNSEENGSEKLGANNMEAKSLLLKPPDTRLINKLSQNIDPLALLSDYQTGDEDERKKYLKLVQDLTLKAQGMAIK